MSANDSLQPIPDEDISKLRDLYKQNYSPAVAYICNYLDNVIKWRSQYPNESCITIFAPSGKWEEDGTFIGIHELDGCCELFMFSNDKECRRLCDCLKTTNRIIWDRSVILYTVSQEYYPHIIKAVEETPYQVYDAGVTDIWWMSKENALNLEIVCPPDAYIEKLNKTHAKIMNAVWPPRFKDSDKYLEKFIELNGGYGVFLKSNGKLVAWGIRNLIGIGTLQTDADYKRKGYGSLITKYLAKFIAEEGFDPIGTVSQRNVAAKVTFKRSGFEIVGTVIYGENQELRKDLPERPNIYHK